APAAPGTACAARRPLAVPRPALAGTRPSSAGVGPARRLGGRLAPGRLLRLGLSRPARRAEAPAGLTGGLLVDQAHVVLQVQPSLAQEREQILAVDAQLPSQLINTHSTHAITPDPYPEWSPSSPAPAACGRVGPAPRWRSRRRRGRPPREGAGPRLPRAGSGRLGTGGGSQLVQPPFRNAGGCWARRPPPGEGAGLARPCTRRARPDPLRPAARSGGPAPRDGGRPRPPARSRRNLLQRTPHLLQDLPADRMTQGPLKPPPLDGSLQAAEIRT